MSEPLLVAEALVRRFASPGEAAPVTVLDGVSLCLAHGETLALTGESGSGKSTLLTLIAGLDRPDGGTIHLDGIAYHGLDEAALARLRRDRVGLVFQQFNLIPALTAGQNLAFQARLAGRHDPHWCAHLAHALGIAAHLDKFPEALSGGQQQRVAIGRVLAARPGLILADEPTGNLDEDSAGRVMELLLSLVAETGAGLILVTHSAAIAARLSRRLHLSHGRLG